MGVEQGRSAESKEIPQKLRVAICSTPWLAVPSSILSELVKLDLIYDEVLFAKEKFVGAIH